MSRVVLDTNVVVAAFAARGLCESVYEVCIQESELIASDYLMTELGEKLLSKLCLPVDLVEEIVQSYTANCRRVAPAEVDPSRCRDPEDLPVLGTCLSGDANFLVTGDKDLLVLESFEGTRIVSPRAFYEQLFRPKG